MQPTVYFDGGRTAYLELHAMRAPVGGYCGPFAPENDPAGDAYAAAVDAEVLTFERDFGVTIYLLGRSGRHICVEHTPDNFDRYEELRAAAIERANALWKYMRTPSNFEEEN